MPASLGLTLDSVSPALVKLKLATDQSWPELLRREMRLICVSLAHQTQPFGKGKDAQTTGLNAIRGDVLGKRGGIVQVWKPYMPATPGAGRTTTLWAGKSGQTYGIDTVNFDRTGTRLAQTHQQARSRSTGRVNASGNGDQIEGRFTRLRRLLVDPQVVEKHLKAIGKLVGFAKGGWAACATKLGGTRGIPAWVVKQDAPGTIVMRESADDPSVTATNGVRYVHRCLSESQIKEALRIQAEKMSAHADYLIAHESKKAGFDVLSWSGQTLKE